MNALETSERTGAIVIACAVMPGAGTGTDGADAAGASGDGASADADDARLRQAREEAGVTAILHESVPVRYWDHDLGPAQLRLFTVDPAAPGQDGVTGLNGLAGPAELRDLTPAPGRSLDQQSFCVSADGRMVATGWWRWESHGESHAELTAIDMASAARRTLLSAPGPPARHPHLARAWIRVIYRCWLDGVPYNPAMHGAAAALTKQTTEQIAA